jgi:hypothetical protein
VEASLWGGTRRVGWGVTVNDNEAPPGTGGIPGSQGQKDHGLEARATLGRQERGGGAWGAYPCVIGSAPWAPA